MLGSYKIVLSRCQFSHPPSPSPWIIQASLSCSSWQLTKSLNKVSKWKETNTRFNAEYSNSMFQNTNTTARKMFHSWINLRKGWLICIVNFHTPLQQTLNTCNSGRDKNCWVQITFACSSREEKVEDTLRTGQDIMPQVWNMRPYWACQIWYVRGHTHRL